ncbi:Os08g0411800, partial [Oryza sativa Japonica Group]
PSQSWAPRRQHPSSLSLSANHRRRDAIAGAVEAVVAGSRRRQPSSHRRQIRCCQTPPSSCRCQIRQVVVEPSPAVVGAVVSEVVVAGRRAVVSRRRRRRQPLSAPSPDPSPAEVAVPSSPRSSSPAVVIAMPRRIRPVRHVVEDAAISLLPLCSPPAPIGRPTSTRARPKRRRRHLLRAEQSGFGEKGGEMRKKKGL